MSGAALAAAVEALVGIPFRLHGRDPAHGLDCVGVLAAALTACGEAVPLPTGYPLRLQRLGAWLPDPAALGFAAASDPVEPGDVVLLALPGGQFHLAIADREHGWVHAHAGLRRVVRAAALPEGIRAGHWRPLFGKG